MKRGDDHRDGMQVEPVAAQPEADNTPPWEEIETGRYRPRRIRGSCRGRELG